MWSAKSRNITVVPGARNNKAPCPRFLFAARAVSQFVSSLRHKNAMNRAASFFQALLTVLGRLLSFVFLHRNLIFYEAQTEANLAFWSKCGKMRLLICTSVKGRI